MIKSLKLKSNTESILLVEKLIDDIKEEGIINEDNYGNIIVCATEAINNSINHGNKGDENKSVDVIVEYNDKQLSFDIKDEGKGFDFESIPDPTVPENIEKLNGRGVFLIKNLSDEMEFLENGTKIKFSFNL
jgi:serine/threonine-protein kinase RsbW